MAKIRIYVGVWCPWSQVLCLSCHNKVQHEIKNFIINEWPKGMNFQRARDSIRKSRKEDNEYGHITRCSACGKLITAREDVAKTHNAVMKIMRWAYLDKWLIHPELMQSGGMCCNGIVEFGGTTKRGIFGPDEESPTNWLVSVAKTEDAFYEWREDEIQSSTYSSAWQMYQALTEVAQGRELPC